MVVVTEEPVVARCHRLVVASPPISAFSGLLLASVPP
jgi:hypothetical protein